MVISSFIYQCEIQRYNRQPISRTGIELTIGRFFQQMKLHGDDEFQETVRNWTFNLLETRPGLELFTRITKFNKPFHVYESERSYCHYLSNTIHLESQERDVIGVINGKNSPFKIPCAIIFTHELKHLLNYLENPELTLNNMQTTTDLIDSEFHNQEEQNVITGLGKIRNPSIFSLRIKGGDQGTYYYVDGCNDNAFLSAFDKPFRINHL